MMCVYNCHHLFCVMRERLYHLLSFRKQLLFAAIRFTLHIYFVNRCWWSRVKWSIKLLNCITLIDETKDLYLSVLLLSALVIFLLFMSHDYLLNTQMLLRKLFAFFAIQRPSWKWWNFASLIDIVYCLRRKEKREWERQTRCLLQVHH